MSYRERSWPAWFLILAVILLAFNLRPAVASLGAVLDDVRTDLALSGAAAGVLTTLPLLCFAFVGAAAAGWARRFGSHHVLAASLLAMVVGLGVRAIAGSTPLLIVATALALAGMATGNVLIPAFIKAHFPGRVGALTAAYTTSMAIGTAVPAAVTVPIAEAWGGWRYGLAAWALTAAVALIPWLLLARADHPRRRQQVHTTRTLTLRDIAQSTLAWSLALYFGLQALHAYAAFGWLPQIFRDAGVNATHAGLLLAILPACGIPMSLLFPSIAVRMANQRPIVLACAGCYLVGYLGLLLAPQQGALAWALLIGIGGGAFPLSLTMIALRSRHPDVTARLSGFTQSVGYLMAAVGPLAIGALYDLTGGWTTPIWVLIALVVPQVFAGLSAARARLVDDELEHQPQ